jgi:hypothetical protein
MSNELTISASVKFVKGDLNVSRSKSGLRIDVTGDKHLDMVQEIGTSEEAITLGEASVGGYMMLENLDDTNYVEIRPNTGVADLIKLLPGDIALFRTAADAVPYGLANTAACDLRIIIIPA